MLALFSSQAFFLQIESQINTAYETRKGGVQIRWVEHSPTLACPSLSVPLSPMSFLEVHLAAVEPWTS